MTKIYKTKSIRHVLAYYQRKNILAARPMCRHCYYPMRMVATSKSIDSFKWKCSFCRQTSSLRGRHGGFFKAFDAFRSLSVFDMNRLMYEWSRAACTDASKTTVVASTTTTTSGGSGVAAAAAKAKSVGVLVNELRRLVVRSFDREHIQIGGSGQDMVECNHLLSLNASFPQGRGNTAAVVKRFNVIGINYGSKFLFKVNKILYLLNGSEKQNKKCFIISQEQFF